MAGMLLGREAEQARIDALLEHARSGVSGVLVLCGEPGIGKSALLSYATGKADDMTILSATGIKAESELPFSGLADLLHPILEQIGEIPRPQEAALAGALAIGPPVTAEPFTISVATLSLVAVAAERRPLFAVVDDAHWLDAASLNAVVFAVRRLHADRVAVIFAIREEEKIDFHFADFPVMTLQGIGLDASRELLGRNNRTPLSAGVTQHIWEATRGNPLAMLEIPNALTPAQLSGSEPLPELLPAGPEIQRAFERRVATVPDRTRAALVVVAASQSGSIKEAAQACAVIGTSLADLEPAESAGLISNDGLKIQFRHPLIRTVVYQAATPADRRAAHRALAASLDAHGSPSERAWHLAGAAQGEDEAVASALEAAAKDARRRSGPAIAWRAFEKAARLTPDPEQRARRLYEAGNDAYVAGESVLARNLLLESLQLTNNMSLRADIELSRGRIEMWTRSPAAARKILIAAADLIEATDPAKATLMLIDAATTTMQEGDAETGFGGIISLALSVSRRAFEVGRRVGGASEAAAGGTYAKALTGAGGRAEAHRLLLRSLEVIDEKESLWQAAQLIQCAAMFLYFEEFDRMRIPLERLIAAAREASAPGTLPYALGHLAELDFRSGRWAAAQSGASEAVELAAEFGHTFSLMYALACLSWVEAARGKADDCRTHIGRLWNVSEFARTAIAAYVGRILGLLELGLGRNEEAIKHLQPVAEGLAQAGLMAPALFQETPDLIEAYVHTGRRAEAESWLLTLQKQAETGPGTWALAATSRCRGLIEEDFQPAFEEALRLHARTDMPFERARTELCYGERLRRARRRAEARDQLHAALATFEHLGAEPWADRARNELRATGETLRRERSASDELTLQELQVALKVAEGATNREAASALFLSPKTVEAHLSRIYSKLGVRSRTELAHKFAQGSSVAPAVTPTSRR
jgi:DNA-binding CsgD family transcriptional regulator